MDYKKLSLLAKAALVFAVLGFAVSIEFTMRNSAGCSYIDYGKVAMGGLAILTGLIAALFVRGHDVGPGLFAAVIGGGHLAWGLGLIFGPCG